jgi:hypothetical protein
MPAIVAAAVDLPVSAHALSLHSDRSEAADHAASFLAGTPPDESASYWVSDPSLVAYYNDRLADVAPDQIGCVHVLAHEQVDRVDGKLRPTEEVIDFVSAHPHGVTAGGETLSEYWTPATIPDHMEYEAWFADQPREASRFLCPYDLRRLPPDQAPYIMRELGKHHSHVVLSDSRDPAVRLIQLFVFSTPAELPPVQRETLAWATEEGLVRTFGPHEEFTITREGAELFQTWAGAVVLD